MPRLSEFTTEELINACNQNLLVYMESIGCLSGATVEHDGPVSRISLGMPVIGENWVINAKPIPEDEAAYVVSRTVSFFGSRDEPFTWFPFGSGRTAALHEALLDNQFEMDSSYPCMVADLENISCDAPDRIIVRQAQTEQDKRHWAEAARRGFGCSRQLRERFAALFTAVPNEEDFPLRLLLAQDEQEPAAGSTMLCLSGSVAGLYFVATPPEMRRRGIGRAMVKAALHTAKEHGCQIAILQASQMGSPLYRRCGFKTFDIMDAYTIDEMPGI